MPNQISTVRIACKKTVFAEKKEPLLRITTHPTFTVDAVFVDTKSWRGAGNKSVPCPYCHKIVKYKAFRREYSLKKAAKWAGLLLGISTMLFVITFLVYFVGWNIETAMWYFGMWSIIGFVFGFGLLIVQILRYLAFYRKNRYRYMFYISTGLSSQHLVAQNMRNRASWKKLPA